MTRQLTTAIGDIAAAPALELNRSDRVFDLSLAGRCIPAGRAGQPTAGDFYDVGVIGPHRMLIVVGDVAGHGYGAGPRMRRLRSASRHLARRTSSPAEMLSSLDETYGLGDDEDIATVWLGIYDDVTNVLQYASAGHPPPIIAEVGGRSRLLAAASAPPLGTRAVARHIRTHEMYWPSGAVMVAYSDGLVERPERDLERQIHALRELVGRTQATPVADATPDTLAQTLVNAVVPDPTAAIDDVCILVLRRDAAHLGLGCVAAAGTG